MPLTLVPGTRVDRSCVKFAAVPAKNGPLKKRLLKLFVRLRSAFSVSASPVQMPPTAACFVRSIVSRAKLRTDSGASVQVMLFRSFVTANSVGLPATNVDEACTLI